LSGQSAEDRAVGTVDDPQILVCVETQPDAVDAELEVEYPREGLERDAEAEDSSLWPGTSAVVPTVSRNP
jgi:hypothetical protein